MDIICAWCKNKLGEKEGEGETHGICDDCLNHYFPHHADRIRGVLEVDKIEEIYRPRKPRIVQPTKIHRRE